ncbi:hypothetical protein RHMOL_Rhmol01G0097500 [Rhododendron molle]|uniref:Uncharacterized protein n=1 Tax=Rhododendron molle TaxID=49168 RepID=A0ACC0Q0B9_RHOML|nr:hypothetical protein RHMOL_Rhmol01G0097500 [Rhododendron molle]
MNVPQSSLRGVRGGRNIGCGGGEEEESDGGALALAVLCNKTLFPNRIPITIVLTPTVVRFLERGQIIINKNV